MASGRCGAPPSSHLCAYQCNACSCPRSRSSCASTSSRRPSRVPVGFVFASERGIGMHYRNVTRRGLDKALDGAGLEKIRFHDLRHTFASLLISQGENVVWVSRQLGHKKTTSPSTPTPTCSPARSTQSRPAIVSKPVYGSMLDVDLLDRARSQIGSPTPLSPGFPRPPLRWSKWLNCAKSGLRGSRGKAPSRFHTRGVPGSIPGTPTKKGPGDGPFRFRS